MKGLSVRSYKLNLSCVDATNVLKTKRVISLHSNEEYTFIQYDKNYLSTDLIPTYGNYRSVIMNKEGKVVCFAPPKSLHTETFINKYPVPSPMEENKIIAEEFVDGPMINIFCSNGRWEYATKNTIGSPIFKTHVEEAMKYIGLSYDMLDSKYCYTFVLQHPKINMVTKVLYPEMYLIDVYRIACLGETNVEVYSVSDAEEHAVQLDCVKYAKIYKGWNTYSDLVDTYGSMNTAHNVVGVMIIHRETGERCKIRNPVFEKLKHAKGGDAKMRLLYCKLRKQGTGKVKEYLETYPQHKKQFSVFRDDIHMFTQTLFENYIDCYIKRQRPLGEYPKEYRWHMYQLHQKYLNDLKDHGKHVTKSVAIEYYNEVI